MCDWGLPRRLYGRGAALCEASEFLAPGTHQACSWDSVCCCSLGKLPPARFRAQRASEYGTRDSSASQLGWPCPNCQSKLVRAAIGTARGVFARLVPRIDPASSRWPAHSCVQLAPCIEQHSSTASRASHQHASHTTAPRRHNKRQAPPPESTHEPGNQQKVLPPVPEMAKTHDQ